MKTVKNIIKLLIALLIAVVIGYLLYVGGKV